MAPDLSSNKEPILRHLVATGILGHVLGFLYGDSIQGLHKTISYLSRRYGLEPSDCTDWWDYLGCLYLFTLSCHHPLAHVLLPLSGYLTTRAAVHLSGVRSLEFQAVGGMAGATSFAIGLLLSGALKTYGV